jgi:hypothetical protein
MVKHPSVRRRVLLAAAVLLSPVAWACSARPANALAQLSGFVYIDRNNDGILAFEGEPLPELVLPGATVQLFDMSGANAVLLSTTTTNNIGQFLFPNLAAGVYGLQQVQPVEFIDGLDTLGVIRSSSNQINPPGSSVGVMTNDNFSGIVLPADARGDLYNFGELGLKPEYVSKRFLLGTAPPPVFAPDEANNVPEPAAGTLAAIGWFAAVAARRRRCAGAKRRK